MSNSVPAAPMANGSNMLPSGLAGSVLPIIALNPFQNRWIIKASVTSKATIRTWSNARGDGKLFSMNLADQSGSIRATAFNAAVDKFYEMLEVWKIKTPNWRFSEAFLRL